jgi:hypothetical protein
LIKSTQALSLSNCALKNYKDFQPSQRVNVEPFTKYQWITFNCIGGTTNWLEWSILCLLIGEVMLNAKNAVQMIARMKLLEDTQPKGTDLGPEFRVRCSMGGFNGKIVMVFLVTIGSHG